MYIVLGSSQINEKIKGSHSSFLFVDSFCAEENVVFSGGGVRSTPVQLCFMATVVLFGFILFKAASIV